MEEPTLAALAGSGSRRGGGEPETADSEELGRLNAALGRLGEADRRIIHLRHFAGLSFKQIAEVLEQPLGTVLARQHRALKKLRELMDRGPDP
jgi:RNA polymerase sigma-70 factor (ECF subfamily)